MTWAGALSRAPDIDMDAGRPLITRFNDEFKQMSAVYIVRHGQASFASANYDRLSELGVRQAALLADHFADHELRFDHLYSGTLERQIHTARPVLEYQAASGNAVELIQREGFNEFNFRPVLNAYLDYLVTQQPPQKVVLEELMKDKPAFQRFYDGAMQVWIKGELNAPAIEPWLHFKERVISNFRQLLADSRGNVLLATSGGVIGLLMQHVLGVSDRQAISLSTQVFNSSLSKVYFNRKGDISLGMFNGIPHLEHPERRSMISYR